MNHEQLKAVWNYCRSAGLLISRESFERNVAPIFPRASVTDLAVHIRVHARYVGKTLQEIENDLTAVLAAA